MQIIKKKKEEKRKKIIYTIIKFGYVFTLDNISFAYSLVYSAGLRTSLPERVHTRVVAPLQSPLSQDHLPL